MQKFWFEQRQAMLLMSLALASILLIWMSLFLSFRNPGMFREKSQVWNYFLFLFLSGCVSANSIFSNLRNKSKSINFLLLPASTLEKTICSFLFGMAGFWIIYSLIFYAVDYPMVHASNALYGTHWSVINIFKINQYQNPIFNHPCSIMFYEVAICQATCVTSSLYFRQHSFFKTAILMLAIWVAIVLLFMSLPTALPKGGFYDSVLVFEVLDYSGNKLLSVPPWFRVLITVFFSCGIATWLWLISYQRIKEKEIA
jgi:hypothetical protein